MNSSINSIFSCLIIMFFTHCTSDQPHSSMKDYKEPYRGQYHFSPLNNWMNDPNGMFFYKGEYHLFFQYHPSSSVWGPMHWGHAVSSDLIHWQELPVAIFPDEKGYIFSGSAVVDWDNTSGLKSGDEEVIVAIFTYHDPKDELQTQGIAYSNDKGKTWTVYDKNPVLANPGIKDFRDPKVMWLASHEKWFMSLAAGQEIIFYSSKNLLEWEEESRFGSEYGAHGGVWECPDLFEITTENGEKKWILFVSINPGGPNRGSATQYFVGDFDGVTFTTDQVEAKWIDWGRDNYAGVTWSDIPKDDGRRLFIAWMSNWDYGQISPTEKWRSAMTLPRELKLFHDNGNYILASPMVSEVHKLLSTKFAEGIVSNNLPSKIKLPEVLQYKIDIQASLTSESTLSFQFSNTVGDELVLTISNQNLNILFERNSQHGAAFSEKFDGVQTIQMYEHLKDLDITFWFDQSSVEIIINDGRYSITNLIFPKKPFEYINILQSSGNTVGYKITNLNGIWGKENR
jgi:fructan beta-fructosidase